jgi:hypothetical protein
MKWYQVGEIGEAVDLVVESFLEGFLTNIGFAEELTRLGLSVEEQLELLKEQIDIHEKALLSFPENNGTIH